MILEKVWSDFYITDNTLIKINKFQMKLVYKNVMTILNTQK